MSGIINSVGAKSGVIGSTEIPGGYEVGTWVPEIWLDSTDLGAGANVHARYVKTGNLVWLSFHWYKPTISSSGTIKLKGFPFGFKITTEGAYQFLTTGYLRHSGVNLDLDGGRLQMNATDEATLYASDASHSPTNAIEVSGQGHLITTDDTTPVN